MIEVLGRANSINVQKVMWCAHELSLEVVQRDIGGAFGGTGTPEFLAMNPNGQIPVLQDDGFTIWESNAIVRYLCTRYDLFGWRPRSPMQEGKANQWMDWYLSTLHPPMTTVFLQLIRTPSNEMDQQVLDAAFVRCCHYWSIVNQHLAANDYMLGEKICMADIPVGCSAYRWFSLDLMRPDMPHLNRWFETLCARQAFRTHVQLPLT
ncbi:MAG: glutathione S-transferase family protein [Cognatishimia sp.]